jgi:hypothetical protein
MGYCFTASAARESRMHSRCSMAASLAKKRTSSASACRASGPCANIIRAAAIPALSDGCKRVRTKYTSCYVPVS